MSKADASASERDDIDILDGEDEVDDHLTAMFEFFARVEDQRSANPDGCWVWPLAKSNTGYGRVNVGFRQIDTHRYAWELLYGRIPKNREVCHHCDNRACINPNHLFLGTRSDNMVDAREKGRGPGQKLTRVKVNEICAAATDGESRAAIATRYGISRHTVNDIMSGRTWRQS